MLRKFMDYQLYLTEKGKILHPFRRLIQATDTFLYEAPEQTEHSPHIRDAIDIKRWMMLVVVALIPCILMAVWNSGLQTYVYTSGDYRLMNEYLSSSTSLSGYFDFAFKDSRYLTILKNGLIAVVPIIIITYAVGGLWEALFATYRDHEISEGFLVTGILYALILPSTIPYWMVAVGISVGIILSKELFGGSGMNIMNPAMTCRAFLFFTYPGRMSGDIWAGFYPFQVRNSLSKMNQEANLTPGIDGFTQATALSRFNITPEIKKIHIDAIAANTLGDTVETYSTISQYFQNWVSKGGAEAAKLGSLTGEQLRAFVTAPLNEGGLGLSSGYYEDAYQFAALNYGVGHNSDWNFFLGNMLGSLGETSTLACILGAIFLIYTGIGSWRTMLAMTLGAFGTALLFQYGSQFGADHGAWNPAVFGFPAYKHLILGGLAFAIVFMATDPVSSPSMKSARWLFGILAGAVTIIIRIINPAFPEGVMLAILMANVFAPLMDYYSAQYYRRPLRAV